MLEAKSRESMALSTVQIKKALKERKLSYRAIGEMADPPLSLSTIAKNVNKVAGCRSQRARSVIAGAIGLAVEDVFGDRAA